MRNNIYVRGGAGINLASSRRLKFFLWNTLLIMNKTGLFGMKVNVTRVRIRAAKRAEVRNRLNFEILK